MSGGIPPGEIPNAGEEAIEHERRALELYTQLHGIESIQVGRGMTALAHVLDCFSDVDDDEIARFCERANAILLRVEGSSSYNVAANEYQWGKAYNKTAKRSRAANDLDCYKTNLELSLPHYREAARIFRACNHTGGADDTLRKIAEIEEKIRQIGIVRAMPATASKG